jgi:hypothetical protein
MSSCAATIACRPSSSEMLDRQLGGEPYDDSAQPVSSRVVGLHFNAEIDRSRVGDPGRQPAWMRSASRMA